MSFLASRSLNEKLELRDDQVASRRNGRGGRGIDEAEIHARVCLSSVRSGLRQPRLAQGRLASRVLKRLPERERRLHGSVALELKRHGKGDNRGGGRGKSLRYNALALRRRQIHMGLAFSGHSQLVAFLEGTIICDWSSPSQESSELQTSHETSLLLHHTPALLLLRS
jgi:hypothetical protein